MRRTKPLAALAVASLLALAACGSGDGPGEGTVSEAGSAAVNPDTSLGGADSVPDTPDVNTGIDQHVEAEEPGPEG